jgi:protein disulfide-isomerase A6
VIPELRKAAIALVPEPEIRFGTFNCRKFVDWCRANNIMDWPAGDLFHGAGNGSVRYDGGNTAAEMLAFLNENCGTERGLEGILNDRAGVMGDEKVTGIVKEFTQDGEAAKLIADMKAIEGAGAYVSAMEIIMAGGKEALVAEIVWMETILTERSADMAQLDEVKRKVNVFHEFVKKEEPPVQDQDENEDGL